MFQVIIRHSQLKALGASSPLLKAHKTNRFNRIALQQAFSMSARHGKKEGLCLLVQRQVERNMETSVVVFGMIACGPGASRLPRDLVRLTVV